MNKNILIVAGLLIWNAMSLKAQDVVVLDEGAKLTVYHPENPSGVAVMMCPGGGYSHLATSHEGHDMAEWMTGMGVTYAVLEYRMPQQPVDTIPMRDTHAALSVIADNAEKWSVNLDKLGIMGASAGGHLASYTANTDARVKFQILLYPVISMRSGITHAGTQTNLIGKEPSEEMLRSYSVDEIAGAHTPPALMMLSTNDTAVVPQNSLRYYQRLQESGVPCELHIYPTGGHGWGFRDTFPYKAQWTASVEQFIGKL